MKRLATMLLMLSLSVVGSYAQERPVKLTFSGSIVPTSLNLGPNTITDEEHLAGNGTLGQFTLRKLRTDTLVPQPSNTCSSPTQLNLPVVAGAGVFRFQDGSLLTAQITGGALCIDFAIGVAQLTESYQVTGGTGRFSNASGTLALTATVKVALFSPSNSAVFLTANGKIEGTVSGVGNEEQ